MIQFTAGKEEIRCLNATLLQFECMVEFQTTAGATLALDTKPDAKAVGLKREP